MNWSAGYRNLSGFAAFQELAELIDLEMMIDYMIHNMYAAADDWPGNFYMGYDRNLNLIYARTCILAIHSEAPFELHPQPFDADAYEEAMELPIKIFGKCAEYADGKAKLYTRKAGYSGVR